MKTNKLKIINDPVHGFIEIPYEILFDLIQHKYFQRLRRISQTGLLNLIFPGATHTRFLHAIGAMHLMQNAIEHLKQKGTEINEEEQKAALIAILLHDIGHGPFSHALESLLVDDWHHEKISLVLMEELNKEFNGKLSLAIKMFKGEYHRPFFNQLVSSQLDVDRLDYLKRDSFYTGVSEGNVNAERIITMLQVKDDQLMVDNKGIYSIESFLTARMLMYWQVYYHKTSAIAEHTLVQILSRAKELIENGVDLDASENVLYFLHKKHENVLSKEDIARFTSLDDSDIIQAIKQWQYHSDTILSYFCTIITQREFPKTIISSQPFSEKEIDDLRNKTEQEYGQGSGDYLVTQIRRSLLPYNEKYQPIRLLMKNGEDINLVDSENQILSNAITQKTTRYILSYPREINKF